MNSCEAVIIILLVVCLTALVLGALFPRDPDLGPPDLYDDEWHPPPLDDKPILRKSRELSKQLNDENK